MKSSNPLKTMTMKTDRTLYELIEVLHDNANPKSKTVMDIDDAIFVFAIICGLLGWVIVDIL
jgi:hypothetical protein